MWKTPARIVHWLMDTVLAIDQLSAALLRHVQARYWTPITHILIRRRKGKNVLLFSTRKSK
jgi:hypothetical protein